MTTSMSALDAIVRQAQNLYSPPRVALRVLELTQCEQVDLRLLKECIETDPALTAKLLRVVNSAMFGLGQTVGDLGQTLALLGAKPLKMLVLGFSLPEKLFMDQAGHLVDHYWRRTLTKAVSAREICQRELGECGDTAFLCGLLQDIGVLALAQRWAARTSRFGTNRSCAAPNSSRWNARL